MKEKIIKTLDNCKTRILEEYIEIELPVVLNFNYQRVLVRIYPTSDGYYISDNGLSFSECGYNSEYFYNLFMEKDKNNHYDIKLENNYLYKKYEEDYSVIRAVDEFVRFFIYLDDYILGLE